MLQIAVCGESPIAHSVAAACSVRGHAVRMLVHHPTAWRDRLRGALPDGSKFVAALALVTEDPAEALHGAEVAFVCVPHAAVTAELTRIAPHVRDGTLVGGVPGFGGFGLIAQKLINLRCCIFGTQRIPFVIQHCDVGRSVKIGGIRRQTFIGTLPAARARPVAELVEQVLGVRTVPVSHYLNIELSPSNSIVNPARLYALFATQGSRPGVRTEFFIHWDLVASLSLLLLDGDLQQGRRLIPRDTSFVAPILLQYDANNAETLTDRFRGLKALAGRPVPTRQVDGQVTIEPASTYLVEDIDLGLTLVRDILRLAGAQTPQMDEILRWRGSLLEAPDRQGWACRCSPAQTFGTIEALAAALD